MKFINVTSVWVTVVEQMEMNANVLLKNEKKKDEIKSRLVPYIQYTIIVFQQRSESWMELKPGIPTGFTLINSY